MPHSRLPAGARGTSANVQHRRYILAVCEVNGTESGASRRHCVFDPAVSICYVEGGEELLDRVAPLWAELNRHVQAASEHFSAAIAARTFAARKADLMGKSVGGLLRVDLAKTAAGECVGYCVATIDCNRKGEIDSLFVLPDFRNQKIGDALMRRALNWMDAVGVKSRALEVTWGNDRVWNFYRRFGFFPRSLRFIQKGGENDRGEN